jgi:hypothetical protein
MADDPLSHRERALLRRLATLVAQTSAGERSLADRRAKVTALADREHDGAVAAAESELKKRQASIRAEAERLEGEAARKFDALLGAARRRMEIHLKNYHDRTVALGKAWNREYEESKWLAETLVESGQTRIRGEYEALRKSLEKRIAEIEHVHRGASGLLQESRHPPLPPLDATDAEDDPPGSRDQLGADFEAARKSSFAALESLHRTVRPRWLSLTPVMLLMAVSAAAAGYAAYRYLTPFKAESVAMAAGGGAVAMGLILLAIRLLLRRRVPAVSARASQALASARLAGERCIKRARADRDRAGVELLAKRDEELAKAERKIAAGKREVNRRTQVNHPRLRDRHARRLADIRAKQDAELAGIRAQAEIQTREAEGVRGQKVAAAATARQGRLTELDEIERAESGIIERNWKSGMTEVQAGLATLERFASELCPPWDAPAWAAFAGRGTVPPAVPFGTFQADVDALPGGRPRRPDLEIPGPLSFGPPALLDLYDRASLLIHAGKDGGPASVALLRAVMGRLLTAFPPGKVRFTIVDPVGLGQNFAGFMHLADYDEAMVGARIWTDPKHIEQRLIDLTEHMETVIQKYLRNEFQTIQEYNERAGEVAEPYRFLVIADFPVNITESAAKRLASIASSGARCGLYTLIASSIPADGKARPPSWLPISALEQSSAVLVFRDGGFQWRDEEFSKWPLRVDAPPDDDRLTALMHRVGASAKDASRVQVPFSYVSPPAEGVWSLDAGSEVRVPLGRAGAKNLQYFTVGRGTAQHALIAGRTGSGKSTLLHVLITNLALWYSPDEIEMYLVDFKKGVEFKTYATHGLPHARVIAVESEREFGLSVLRRLDAELSRRGQLFREAGAQDVAGYRKTLGPDAPPLPRVMLIVDEFQEFFVEDDKLAQEASLLMDRLVRQGRAFGMHVVLGSQTLGGAYSIARSTLGQMAVRIALQCSEADSYLIMSEDNAAARLLSRPGEAIYNDMSGRLEGNSLFQIVWLPDEVREAGLELVRERLAASGKPPPAPPIVFEGNIPAELPRNHLLEAAAGANDAKRPSTIWLGEAISIKDPTSFVFRRQSGSNLLIVGQQEDTVAAMLIASVLSLAVTAGRAGATLRILDAAPSDSPHFGLFERAAAHWPGSATIHRPRDADAALAELSADLARREAQDQHDAPPSIVLINGLHRLRDLRKSDDYSFSSGDGAAQTPAQQFAHLLREGPPLGIHTLAWCDTATNLDRTLERNSLREFDGRVLFQMSAADSTHLIDAPTAATLGRYRALLHSEESGTTEKFRPYAVPDPEWLSRMWSALRPA